MTILPIASMASVSEASSPSTLMSNESTSSSFLSDHNTMAGAGSLPPLGTSSICTDDSPTSVVLNLASRTASLLDPTEDGDDGETSVASSEAPTLRTIATTRTATPSVAQELNRIHELEQKRVALRHQRFTLEQRLYEFCGKHMDHGDSSSVSGSPYKHVMDMPWRERISGIRFVYTGPVNSKEEPHGHDGLMKFTDGQIYRGDVRHGFRFGIGVNNWPDGQQYSGDWQNNSRNGRGTHTWPDGRSVTGQWREGHLNGKVYFSWPNGATYDGMVVKGKKHGRGVHTWADGRVYSGHFENGKENGFGTLTHPDSVKYRGQFKHGVKEGYGIMLWKTRTYDGEWINNKPHGQGRVVWSNGATYTGQFSEGKYNGLGVYVWPSGKKFVGRWEHGVKNGHGLYTWPNGKKYDGEYKNGLKDGYGRMTWPDGSNYCGSFSRNKRCGRGVHTAADGTMVHCGEWKDDIPIDNGADQSPNASETVSSPPQEEVNVDHSKEVATRPKTDTSKNGAQVEVGMSMIGSLVDISKIDNDDVNGTQYDIISPDIISEDEGSACNYECYSNSCALVQQIAPTRLAV